MTNYQYKYFKFWKILAFKGLILILIASLWPQYGDDSPLFIHVDKVLHFSVYTIASFYIHQVFQNKLFKKITLFLFLYSAMIEILQGMGETRSAEWSDLMANLLGILFGFYLSKKCILLEKIDKFIART